jgi:catechol 2,3-dioxygenase-like lactoylglutathione lyase family enzyme
MSDQVAHQYVGHIVVNRWHGYPNRYYSNFYQIASPTLREYIPRISASSENLNQEDAMIRGIKIVTIPVSDQDRALKFYSEKMGFKVATDQAFGPGQRWIELLIPGSDVNLALFTPPGHESRIGGFQPLTFWCDDVFATANLLKSKGVELTAEPKKETWGTMAKFKDPDGNEFVFSSR